MSERVPGFEERHWNPIEVPGSLSACVRTLLASGRWGAAAALPSTEPLRPGACLEQPVGRKEGAPAFGAAPHSTPLWMAMFSLVVHHWRLEYLQRLQWPAILSHPRHACPFCRSGSACHTLPALTSFLAQRANVRQPKLCSLAALLCSGNSAAPAAVLSYLHSLWPSCLHQGITTQLLSHGQPVWRCVAALPPPQRACINA